MPVCCTDKDYRNSWLKSINQLSLEFLEILEYKKKCGAFFLFGCKHKIDKKTSYLVKASPPFLCGSLCHATCVAGAMAVPRQQGRSHLGGGAAGEMRSSTV